MNDYRNGNGVKNRFDGQGDQWANAHREFLPGTAYLTDVDAVVGMTAFARNGGDTLFLEYTPDAYANRGNLVRSFGLVALFDRKRTHSVAGCAGSILSAGFYLDICRTYAGLQPVAPRFFFVFGQAAPFELQELDIWTGDWKPDVYPLTDEARGWCEVWRVLGLFDAHQKLAAWLKAGKRVPT